MLAALLLVLLIGCALAVWKDLVHQRSDVSAGHVESAREAPASARRSLRSFLPRSRKPDLPREDRAPLPGHITCPTSRLRGRAATRGSSSTSCRPTRRRACTA